MMLKMLLFTSLSLSFEFQQDLGSVGWKRNMEKRRLWEDLIVLHYYLKADCNNVRVSLFSQVTSERRRESCLKLCQGREIQFGIQEQFFPQKGCLILEQAAQQSRGVTIPGGI